MKKLTFLAVVSLLAVLLTACSPAAVTPPPVEPTTTTVLDDMGREITLKANPQRIVSLAPSTTEILFALGVLDRVVGVTDVCLYPPEAQEIPHAGTFFQPSVETIVSMNPDVVFAASLHKEPVEQLDALGISVVVLDPQTITDILANIRLVGESCGCTGPQQRQ
jgi:iron complex transport system substrate-binding protein